MYQVNRKNVNDCLCCHVINFTASGSTPNSNNSSRNPEPNPQDSSNFISDPKPSTSANYSSSNDQGIS